jgi:hypothetical protein
MKANDVPPGTPYTFNAQESGRRFIRNFAESILGSLDDSQIQEQLLRRCVFGLGWGGPVCLIQFVCHLFCLFVFVWGEGGCEGGYERDLVWWGRGGLSATIFGGGSRKAVSACRGRGGEGGGGGCNSGWAAHCALGRVQGPELSVASCSQPLPDSKLCMFDACTS